MGLTFTDFWRVAHAQHERYRLRQAKRDLANIKAHVEIAEFWIKDGRPDFALQQLALARTEVEALARRLPE